MTGKPSPIFRCPGLSIERQRNKDGIDALFHVLRWQRATTIRNHNGLKLNNNHTALAARELMEIYPQLDGFFEVRIRKPRGNWGQIH